MAIGFLFLAFFMYMLFQSVLVILIHFRLSDKLVMTKQDFLDFENQLTMKLENTLIKKISQELQQIVSVQKANAGKENLYSYRFAEEASRFLAIEAFFL
jgi:hypothetical protein